MVQAITYNNITIVEYLISHSSYRTIATTQYENMTFLEHAKKAHNLEAENTIQKAADTYLKRPYLRHPLVRAGLCIITIPLVLSTLTHLYICWALYPMCRLI